MRIEVEVATYAMLRRIAAGIDARCRRAVGADGGRPILIVPPSAAAATGRARFLLAELETFALRMEQLSPAPAEEGGEGVTLATFAAGVKAAAAALGPTLDVITKAVGVTETHAGRLVTVEESALTAALGGHMIRLKLNPQIVGGDVPLLASVPPALTRVRLAGDRLRAAAKDADARAEAAQLLARVDAALALFAAPGGDLSPGWQLMSALGQDSLPLALIANVLAAGGHYRLRRHLGTMLGLADPLSFSGGAAVRFALLEPRTGRLPVHPHVRQFAHAQARRAGRGTARARGG